MEFWAAGGCIHRCDGERTADGEPCNTTELVDVGRKRLNPHTEAKPTTRLSLMLPELEAIGAWRMESHGWNAAAEIPAVAELAQFVGDLVPAHLNMIERRSVKDGKTSRFVVPVLDLQIGAARLREIVAEKSGTTTELEGPTQGRAALPAGSSKTTAEPDPYDAFFARVAAAASTDDLIVIWDQGKAAHLLGPAAPQNQRHVDLVAAWKARAHDLKDAATQPAPAQPAAAVPDEDGVVDAEIVPDTAAGPSEDEVWQQILKAGGEQGMSLPDVEDGYNAFSGGLMSAEASAGELQAYLQHLVARQDQAVPA
ncbi:hypothetical protein NPS01_25160 [Nocardioides psychrotolerans]|nr:hypothetical protein NPS01_25160 [Nocardioides psychrotolerans]